MTDIALLMTSVLTTGQPSPPIAPELLIVQRDSDREKLTQGQLSQTVSTAQITPPEFMQPEETAQLAASVITIENKSILNSTEINILSEIPCLGGSENFLLVGKDSKDILTKAFSFGVCAPEMLLSFEAIPKLVTAHLGNTFRSFHRSRLKESTYNFVKFQIASEMQTNATPNQRQQRPSSKPTRSEINSQIYGSKLPTLGFGNSGITVRILQRLLLSNGYGIGVDGIFGALTERAVQSFQERRKIKVDGIVGQRTWYELTK